MRKTALTILVAASGAALLLVLAATNSQGFDQPHPYTASAWLAAMLAIAIFVVMLVEYYIHGRQTHLYFSAAFLALGIIGIWDALALSTATAGQSTDVRYLALWKTEWITLALALICGVVANRFGSLKRPIGLALCVIPGGILWAALVVFCISISPAITTFLTAGKSGTITSIVCALIFAFGCIAYTQPSVNRNNAVLLWLAYGLVFAVFAGLAMAFVRNAPHNLLYGFAALMRLFTYLAPLSGMLAEHARMHVSLRDQASDMSNLLLAQHAMSSIESPVKLQQRIVELVSSSFSTAAVCVLPFNESRGLLRITASTGFSKDIPKQLVFRSGEGPAGKAFSDKQTIFVRDVSTDPILSRKLDGVSGIGSAVFIPLIVAQECFGVMAVFFGGRPMQAQRLQKEQARLLDALATQAALAVRETRKQSWLHDSAKGSDGQAWEMDVISEIGQAVSSTLELQELVDILVEKLRVALGAKTCSVLVFDPDEVGLKILGNKSLTRHRSLADHVDRCDIIAAAVAKQHEAVISNNVPNSSHCKYSEMAVDNGGTHHLLSAPMSLRGFTGAINVFRQDSEPFGDVEKGLLERLAPLVAIAIRNAELYERERKIAQSLQKSFIPDVDPFLPGIEVSVRYKAAFDESLVGGDFYDITDLGGGAYGVAIGDVTGKGLDAAIYTAMTRYMIQAYSSHDADPVSVISKLNSALNRYMPPHKFVTLVYGVLDTGNNKFVYVNAGHEPPFVYRAARGSSEALETTGPAAGAISEGEFHSKTILLDPGDTLILYTDGASEARKDQSFLGTEGLKEMIDSHMSKKVDDLPGALLDSITSYADGRLHDDIAILVVKIKTPGSLF